MGGKKSKGYGYELGYGIGNSFSVKGLGLDGGPLIRVEMITV